MARIPRESWRSDPPATISDARDRLIDATGRCFSRFGVAKTTLEDIASEAGVSRATVYRYFEGGRDEIILGVVLREAKSFLEVLQRRVQRKSEPATIVTGHVMCGRWSHAACAPPMVAEPSNIVASISGSHRR